MAKQMNPNRKEQLQRARQIAEALSIACAEIVRETESGEEPITLEEVKQIAEDASEIYNLLEDIG